MSGELILQAVISGLLMGLIYALVAVGLTLIFGLMEIVNFAHGEFLMLAMFPACWFWALAGLDPLLSLPFVAVLLALIRQTPRGQLRISKLTHAGGWSVAPQAIPKQGR